MEDWVSNDISDVGVSRVSGVSLCGESRGRLSEMRSGFGWVGFGSVGSCRVLVVCWWCVSGWIERDFFFSGRPVYECVKGGRRKGNKVDEKGRLKKVGKKFFHGTLLLGKKGLFLSCHRDGGYFSSARLVRVRVRVRVRGRLFGRGGFSSCNRASVGCRRVCWWLVGCGEGREGVSPEEEEEGRDERGRLRSVEGGV